MVARFSRELVWAAIRSTSTRAGASGLGASRMGPSGLLRFLRKKALLIQRGTAKDMSSLEEAG